MASGWQALGKEIGISPATYSSTNVMRHNHQAPDVNTVIPIQVRGGGSFASIEFLADEVAEHFSSTDYRFPTQCEVINAAIADLLSRAFE